MTGKIIHKRNTLIKKVESQKLTAENNIAKTTRREIIHAYNKCQQKMGRLSHMTIRLNVKVPSFSVLSPSQPNINREPETD